MKLSKKTIGLSILTASAIIVLALINTVMDRASVSACYGVDDANALELVRTKMSGITMPGLKASDISTLQVLSIRETLPPNKQMENIDYYGKVISFGRGQTVELKATVYSDCGIEWSK